MFKMFTNVLWLATVIYFGAPQCQKSTNAENSTHLQFFPLPPISSKKNNCRLKILKNNPYKHFLPQIFINLLCFGNYKSK